MIELVVIELVVIEPVVIEPVVIIYMVSLSSGTIHPCIWSLSHLVPSIHVSGTFVGHQESLGGASRGRQIHGSLALCVAAVDISTELQQHLSDGGVASLDRRVEGRV